MKLAVQVTTSHRDTGASFDVFLLSPAWPHVSIERCTFFIAAPANSASPRRIPFHRLFTVLAGRFAYHDFFISQTMKNFRKHRRKTAVADADACPDAYGLQFVLPQGRTSAALNVAMLPHTIVPLIRGFD
ncbi:Protein of unknown function [Pyronema omphalodes CBS 100304]|uniref:Uncharacterized protein n=1 Tax=Pyronema omphalodes (strain CBS 100304) TaxID=1076935 RepID=U4LQY4_PYROM|nr:Protein of unknown function [Pyronema omphalodes CBS 100304]